MGVDGLLKLLGGLLQKQHLSSFRGQRAAVDIMSWLYKGCYRCALEFYQQSQSNNFLYYVSEMLDLLAFYSITPLCVFDGRCIPKKSQTLERRRRLKQENKQRGLQLLAIGDQEQARKYLGRCIIIDERVVSTTMRMLKSKGVEFIVAPYQADSQIAKLVRLKIVDFAISEDSDLVVYGVKSALKLTAEGDCELLDIAKWQPSQAHSCFIRWYLELTPEQRIEAAVLSGTDYNSSIRGIGIKKAVKHLKKLGDYTSVIQYLRNSRVFSPNVPSDYERTVLQSKLIFMFATVYSPISDSLQLLDEVNLTKFMPAGMSVQELLKIVGPHFTYTQGTVSGQVNVKTLEPRNIYPLQIKMPFTINPAALMVRESLNKQRQVEREQILQRLEEEKGQIGSGDQRDQIIEKKLQKKERKVRIDKKIKEQLTEEEKKLRAIKNKQEKGRRLEELKHMLNQFMSDSMESQEENSEDTPGEIETPAKQIQRTGKQSQTKSEQKVIVKQNVKEQSEAQSEQSLQDCLKLLNPWAKAQQPKFK